MAETAPRDLVYGPRKSIWSGFGGSVSPVYSVAHI